jgi:tetratricopeptide (TPR) repeat protein
MDIQETAERAFQLGEKEDAASQQTAISLYRAIVAEHPYLLAAWFNLGVLHLRSRQEAEAITFFQRAEATPDLKILAAFARLQTMRNIGRSLQAADFPPEFRGERRGALDVLGPCHNTATLFRNSGWSCRIEQSDVNPEAGSIITNFAHQDYTISINYVMGTLVKNVYKNRDGKSFRLTRETAENDHDRAILGLPVGTMPLMQIRIRAQEIRAKERGF